MLLFGRVVLWSLCLSIIAALAWQIITNPLVSMTLCGILLVPYLFYGSFVFVHLLSELGDNSLSFDSFNWMKNKTPAVKLMIILSALPIVFVDGICWLGVFAVAETVAQIKIGVKVHAWKRRLKTLDKEMEKTS